MEINLIQKIQYAPASGCWLWVGHIADNGYGKISCSGVSKYAHRVAYEQYVGAIGKGMVIDHLCGIKHCCNPEHLEAVTQLENVRRGPKPVPANSKKTHCLNGHELAGHNLYMKPSGRRACMACARAHRRKHHARKKTLHGGSHVHRKANETTPDRGVPGAGR